MVQRIIREIEIFQTSDGKEFNNSKDAITHQVEIDKTPEQRAIDDFLNSYCYKGLKQQGYDLQTFGIWEVRGEDSNADFGGCHHEPYLGTVQGTMSQALKWGMKQKKWFSYGSGGSLRKIEIISLKNE
ncbi:hypothetical protein [Caulobacter phage Cr30]|uniref:hypothetical protein n=1 Tax=Caulobacter phage Cr30 TaxID=1357714 RepID=UPI0004A9B418|nr:hypothetical protein OZ74_gp163 [Caulobacter phage Cr30]AGS81048.1 hypothetical protein [Caulobacter phage Cr30]